MSKFEDITNKEFGNLIAKKFIGRDEKSRQIWEFECKLCGSITNKKSNLVKTGKIISCGCQRFAGNKRTHGMAGTPIYCRWKQMRQRCKNNNVKNYHNYGGRGIKVCERWEDFKNFFIDMGYPPSDNHSIERKDNNGDYCPENCEWATRIEQSCNTRVNKLITYNNKTQTVSQWANELNIPRDRIYTRLRRGATDEEALKI